MFYVIRVLFEKKGGCGTGKFPICLSVTKHLGFLCSDYSRSYIKNFKWSTFYYLQFGQDLDKLHRSKFV